MFPQKSLSAIADNDLRKCRLSDFSTLGSSDLGSNGNLNSSLTFCFSYITLVEARPVQGATIINYCTDKIYRYEKLKKQFFLMETEEEPEVQILDQDINPIVLDASVSGPQ